MRRFNLQILYFWRKIYNLQLYLIGPWLCRKFSQQISRSGIISKNNDVGKTLFAFKKISNKELSTQGKFFLIDHWKQYGPSI